MELTPYELVTLRIIARHGPYHYKSAIGYAVSEAMPAPDRKRNPSPQGMALFASRFIRRLIKLELVRDDSQGIQATAVGRLELLAHAP